MLTTAATAVTLLNTPARATDKYPDHPVKVMVALPAGGNVDLLFAPLPEALPHIKSGKLTALAIMGDKRSPPVAETPTMKEAGIDIMRK